MINKKAIKNSIIEGKLEKAIKMLLKLSEKYDSDVNDSAILLSSRYNSLKRDNGKGTITPTDLRMSTNRITHALNEIIDDVKDSWEVEDTISGNGAVNQNDGNNNRDDQNGGDQKSKKIILVLAANPKDTDQLRLGEEVREIEEGMKRSKKRDDFEVVQKWAVRKSDLRRALLDETPSIVHFSGHGSAQGRIILEDKTGNSSELPPVALGNLFKSFKDSIECVILNACYSELQATEISKHISYVVGMNDAIPDKAAIEFSTAFYDTIGSGRDVPFAFDIACNSIDLSDLDAADIPVLLEKVE